MLLLSEPLVLALFEALFNALSLPLSLRSSPQPCLRVRSMQQGLFVAFRSRRSPRGRTKRKAKAGGWRGQGVELVTEEDGSVYISGRLNFFFFHKGVLS